MNENSHTLLMKLEANAIFYELAFGSSLEKIEELENELRAKIEVG